MTVTSPLCPFNVVEAAAEAGAALAEAYNRKMKDTAEACRHEGIAFLPFAMETLGGLHPGVVATARQLAAALARCKWVEECGDQPAVWQIVTNPDASKCSDDLDKMPGCRPQ